MLYVLTFVKISRLDLLQTLQQPIGVVFSVLAVEIERTKREAAEFKKGLKNKMT